MSLFAVSVCGLAGVLALPGLLSPAWDIDTLIYNLGLPWQILTGRRFPLEWVEWNFQLPELADLAAAVPLALDDERPVRFAQFFAIAAVAVLHAGCAGRRGIGGAAWLGAGLAICLTTLRDMVGSAKPDVIAAALLVAGTLAAREGGKAAGAACLALGTAAKPSIAPISLGLMLATMRGRDLRRGAAAFALVMAPWIAKSWLATGNPVFPFLDRLFHSPFSGPLEDSARAAFLATLAPHAWGDVAGTMPIMVWLAPLIAVSSRARPVALACLAGACVTFALVGIGRHALAAAWLLALIAAEELVRRAAWRRAAARSGAAGLVAAGIVWVLLPGRKVPAHGNERIRDRRTAVLGNYLDAADAVRRERISRLITVGEPRTCWFPARVIYGGFYGERPLVWSLVRESGSEARLLARFRQLGAGGILYNYVTADQLPIRYAAFRWDWPAVELWKGFCRRHLALVRRGPPGDTANGGFYLYAIRRRANPAPSAVWFLPGAETLWTDMYRLEAGGKLEEALAAARRVRERIPDVGCARTAEAHILARLNRLAQAEPLLR
jgi:hypothetical protein